MHATDPRSDDVARSALGAWAALLGDAYTLTAMPRVTNPLWRVEIGDRPATVLKLLPEYPAGVDPVTEFRVLSHLRGAGVSVPVPVVTDAGDVLATVGDRRWMLLPLLPHQTGNHESGPEAGANAFAVGAAIGRLDRALAAYPWPVSSFVDDPTKVIREALPQLPEEGIELVRPFVDRLLDACTDLPVQLTHGDCNDGNVLVGPRLDVGFLDIDHLPTGPRVRDLAYYLASRLRRHLQTSHTAVRTTTALGTLITRYVDGYQDAYPLTRQEVRAIVPLLLVIEVGGAHWALHGWEPDPDSYRRSLGSLAWLTSRYDELIRATAGSP